MGPVQAYYVSNAPGVVSRWSRLCRSTCNCSLGAICYGDGLTHVGHARHVQQKTVIISGISVRIRYLRKTNEYIFVESAKKSSGIAGRWRRIPKMDGDNRSTFSSAEIPWKLPRPRILAKSCYYICQVCIIIVQTCKCMSGNEYFMLQGAVIGVVDVAEKVTTLALRK